MQLIAVAFLLSAPIAWWVMKDWLMNFEYRVDLSPVFFILALLATVIVALMTVGLQSVKAALANPVQSLRNE